MKIHKTSSKHRMTYRYTGQTTEVTVLLPESQKPTGVVLSVKDEMRYVPDHWIHDLHNLDDCIVRNNLKNLGIPLTKEEREAREADQALWEEEHPGEAYPDRYNSRRWHIRLDDVPQGMNNDPDNRSGDKRGILVEISEQLMPSEDPAIERLHEIVDGFSEEWQDIYDMVYLQGYSIRAAGRELGYTEPTIRRIVHKIKDAIANDPELNSYRRL